MARFYAWVLLSAALACMTGMTSAEDSGHREHKAYYDGSNDAYPCTAMNGPCRFTTDERNGQSSFIISCDCSSYEEKDVSSNLKNLVGRACQGKPTDDTIILNLTSISVIECKIDEVLFPDEMMAMLRRSEHLDINIQDSQRFRMGPHKASSHVLPKITAAISSSKISGLVSGWFTGTQNLDLKIKDSVVDVVDSKAFLGFPSQAVTNIMITNTTITTIKRSAMELPAESIFTMDNCTVVAWSASAYVGGRSLVLSNLREARMLQSAINIRGLESFKLLDSSFAELNADAIIDREVSYMSNEQNSKRVRVANITGNTFARSNGEAFVNLCEVEQLIFKNNQFLEIEQPPVRLCPKTQDGSFNRHDWTQVFRNNGLPCNDCDDFSDDNNKQVCNMYTSSHCTCSNSTLTPSCKDGASLTKTLYDVCYFEKTECQETEARAAKAAAVTTAHSTNDALPSTKFSTFIIMVLSLAQLGYLVL